MSSRSTARLAPNILVTPASSIMRALRRFHLGRLVGPALKHQANERKRHLLAEDDSVGTDPRPGRHAAGVLNHLEGAHRLAVPVDQGPALHLHTHTLDLPGKRVNHPRIPAL